MASSPTIDHYSDANASVIKTDCRPFYAFLTSSPTCCPLAIIIKCGDTLFAVRFMKSLLINKRKMSLQPRETYKFSKTIHMELVVMISLG